MQTVFSHVIQKRFSQVNEDVATDALAFIRYNRLLGASSKCLLFAPGGSKSSARHRASATDR